MSEMKRNPEAVAELIREARTIAVVSHVNPDGDTIGCATAMRLGLKALGKDVTLFCDGKIPDDLGFLPGAAEFRHPEGYEGSFDLMLSVDVSDERRLGSCAELKKISRRTAQIDHHPTNPLFMEVNSVDGHAPAACLMIREQLRVLGVELTTDIAKCLYTGISTDTGNFAFAATNAECFEVMAELMRAGLPLAELNRILFRVRSRPQALLIGKALGHGGFSVTYLGYDTNLQIRVAVKEYLPSEYATRVGNESMVTVSEQPGDADHYMQGIDKFIQEAQRMQLLANREQNAGIEKFIKLGRAYLNAGNFSMHTDTNLGKAIIAQHPFCLVNCLQLFRCNSLSVWQSGSQTG